MSVKKILIVDDDSDDREMFCEALKEVTPDSICYTAASGRAAIMLLENREMELPDLIFLDVNMPVMNGSEFLSIIKRNESYNRISVIIYSTSSFLEDVEKAQRAGALCFFTKPSNFNTLKESLFLVVQHLSTGSLKTLSNSSPLFLTY